MTMRFRSRHMLHIVGIGMIVLLMVVPLLLFPGSNFSGSDRAGAEAVARLAPQYDSSWSTNWWAPGTETESMLFALQATVGGVLIGYVFGFLRGRRTGVPPADAPVDKQ